MTRSGPGVFDNVAAIEIFAVGEMRARKRRVRRLSSGRHADRAQERHHFVGVPNQNCKVQACESNPLNIGIIVGLQHPNWEDVHARKEESWSEALACSLSQGTHLVDPRDLRIDLRPISSVQPHDEALVAPDFALPTSLDPICGSRCPTRNSWAPSEAEIAHVSPRPAKLEAGSGRIATFPIRHPYVNI
ncbi:hypothetical protein [Mesorhizobium sp. M0809]|uniref:hypothetical protein n=1 Tax=Mesorhizobium sp. M0809 TaxID=2957003 RepID=UPI00333CF297